MLIADITELTFHMPYYQDHSRAVGGARMLGGIVFKVSKTSKE
jgi:hypothetical protein